MKKTQTSMFAFFSVQGGVLPPPPPHCRNEAYYARPDFCLPIMHGVIRPRLTHSEAASPEDWLCAAFTRSNHRVTSGPAVAPCFWLVFEDTTIHRHFPVIREGKENFQQRTDSPKFHFVVKWTG
jgi:hypothetical protein